MHLRQGYAADNQEHQLHVGMHHQNLHSRWTIASGSEHRSAFLSGLCAQDAWSHLKKMNGVRTGLLDDITE